MLWIVVALSVLSLAFVGIGHLDQLVPGRQLEFLSPDGKIVALNRTGGKSAVTEVTGPVQLTQTNQIPLAAFAHWGSWVVAPVRQSGSGIYGLQVKSEASLKSNNGDNGSFQKFNTVNAHDFQWVGADLYFVGDNGIHKVSYVAGSDNSSIPTFNEVIPISGNWDGIYASQISKAWKLAIWQGQNLRIGDATNNQVYAVPGNDGIAAAGFDHSGAWVTISKNGNIVWQSGEHDQIASRNARFLPDATGKGILLWDRVSGDLYRITKGSHTKVATAITGATVSAAGDDPQTILLGGNLAEGVRASGDGFEHLGTFHHIGKGGIASFTMEPQLVSSVSVNANFTFSFIAPAGTPWSLKLVDSNGAAFKNDTGTTNTTGIIPKIYPLTASIQGRCSAILSLYANDTITKDTLNFLSDWTAPSGNIVWSGSQVSPTHGLVVDLNGVVDDGDIKKPVYLLAIWGNGSSSFKIVKPSNGLITINGKDPITGAWLPEGEWDVKWLVVDSVGNQVAVSNAPKLTVRTTTIQARASFDPTIVNPGPVSGTLSLELSEVASKAQINAKVYSGGVQIGSPILGTVTELGTFETSQKLNLGIQKNGICTLSVRGIVGADSFITQSQIIVGSVQAKITWPQAGSKVAIHESFPIWGIAPDLWPGISGNAMYRISVHHGNWVAPASPKWNDLSNASGALLQVNAATINANPTLLARDLTGYPGSVGSISKLSQEVNLATLRGKDIAPGDATLALWIGKGDSLRVVTLGFQVVSSSSAQDSTFALSRISQNSIINLADADKSNDSIVWKIHKGSFESVDLSVRCGISNAIVYTIAAMKDSTFQFSGLDGLKRPLADNSCVLRIEGDQSGQQIVREDAFSVVAFKPKLSLNVAGTYDASLALLAGKAALLPITVSNPRGDYFRIHLYSNTGIGLGSIDSSSQASFKDNWNGQDSLKHNWFQSGQNDTLQIAIEHKDNASWIRDTTAKVVITAVASEQANLGLHVDGYDYDTLRVAALHSDWKIRARLEGALAYFPKRDVDFRIYPEGQQTARRYLPTDYAMEWAKYYTSIAGYTNWSATWRAMGYRLGIEWTDSWIPFPYFVWRTPTEYKNRHAEGVPFWYFSHPGSPSISSRKAWSVVNFDSNDSIDRSTMVGTSPYFDQRRGLPPLEIEKNNTRYTFDPSTFFGDGYNRTLANVDNTNTNFDTGYSGYLGGSPFDGFINAQWNEIKSEIDSVRGGLIGRYADAVPKGDTNSLGVVKYEHTIPDVRKNVAKDKNLVLQLAANVPAAMLCKNADMTEWIFDDSSASGSMTGNLSYLSLNALRDSLAHIYDSTKMAKFVGNSRICADTSLLALSEAVKRDSTVKLDTTIDFQSYLNSMARSVESNGWKDARNVGAIMDLTRSYVGFTDDAHFDPLPESWQQYHYVLPPGKLAVDKDNAEMLLEKNSLTSSTGWELGLDNFSGSYKYSITGKEKIVPFNTHYKWDGLYDDETCTGNEYAGHPNWYFSYRSIFGAMIDEDYGERYSCGISRTQMPGVDFQDSVGTYNGSNGWDLGLREQRAFTPPPGINWNHPWFTLHDNKVTVVHHTLYADDSVVSIPDGIRWQDMISGKTTDSLASFGGYKNGQIGYWFKPADSIQSNGNFQARNFPVNAHGQSLSEVDWVDNYRTHVHPDSSKPSQWSTHDLVFAPNLRVNDKTRGVVWDTTSINWPDIHRETVLDRHIQRTLLADTMPHFDSTDLGRTWGEWHVQLAPDSLWVPSAKNLSSVPEGTPQVALARSLLPKLPDQQWTGINGRTDSLVSFVHGESLKFGIIPQYRGMLLDGMSRVIWSDTAMSTSLSWQDIYARSQKTQSFSDAKISAAYGYTPDTLGFWSSAQDSLLSSTQGWIGLAGALSQSVYQPISSGLKLLPVSSDTTKVPCYRPWVTNAFVRSHDSGKIKCTDSVTVNPNLFRSNAKWNIEVFAPDGQTPNTDLGPRGVPTLQNVSLALDAGRSSRRWIRVLGALPTTRLVAPDAVPWTLNQWQAYAIGDTGVVPLDLQLAWTDSSDRTKGIRSPGSATLWAHGGDSDAVWIDVTGLCGTQKVAVTAEYVGGTQRRRFVQILPYVVGEPRRTDSAKTIADAYHRATLVVPASGTDTRPVVLNTIAGNDLAALPLGGVVPAGPVISMQPSGMRFDSAPATLRYSLTLREVLALSGRTVTDTQTVFDKANLDLINKWAKSNLSVWLLSQDGKLEKAPTDLTTDGDTSASAVLLDGYRFDLIGSVTHFSWAMVLSGDASKNIAPNWRLAVGDAQNMQLSLGLTAWKSQNLAYPATIHVYSADRQIDWLVSSSQGRADTTVAWSNLPSSIADLWRAGGLTLFARVDSGAISSRMVDGSKWTPNLQDTCTRLLNLTVTPSNVVLPSGAVSWKASSTLSSGQPVVLMGRLAGTQAWTHLDSVTSTTDSFLSGQFASTKLSKGTWVLRAACSGDSSCYRDTSLNVTRDSLGLGLHLSDSDVVIGSQVLVHATSVPGVNVTIWADSMGIKRVLRAPSALINGSWQTVVTPTAADSQVIWLKGVGILGGVDSIRQVLHAHAQKSQWLTLKRNADSIYPDWAQGVLYRHKWDDSAKIQVVANHAKQVHLIGRIDGWKVIDTIDTLQNSLLWSYKPSVKHASRFDLELSIRNGLTDTFSADTLMSWNVLPPPAAVAWNGSNSVGSSVLSVLANHGIEASILSSEDQLSDWFVSRPKGCVIFLDSVLPSFVWGGAERGELIPWVRDGGNVVFSGAPAFSARDSSHVTIPAGPMDGRRVSIYGFDPVSGSYDLYQRFISGIRMDGLKTPTEDDFAKRSWPTPPAVLTPASRLRWFDSAGISVDAGFTGIRIDSLMKISDSGKVKDTTWRLDTIMGGGLLYFPPILEPHKGGVGRKGAILELPQVDAQNASSAGAFIYNSLFVPDLGVGANDVLLSYRVKGSRSAGQWKPVRGDTVDMRVRFHLRDGGVIDSIDSVHVHVRAEGLLKDTVLVVHHVLSGSDTTSVVSFVIPDRAKYGTYPITISLDTLVTLDLKRNSLKEAYLTNNQVETLLDVGELSLPQIHWLDSVQFVDNKVWRRLRPLNPGALASIPTKAWSIHDQTGWQEWYQLRTTVSILNQDSLVSTTDTARWDLPVKIGKNAENGQTRTLELIAQDRYKNLDSIQLILSVDAVSPKIDVLKIAGLQGLAPSESSTDSAWEYLVPKDSVTKDGKAHLHLEASDNVGLDTVTCAADVWKTNLWSKKIAIDTMIAVTMNLDSVVNPTILRVVDLAGNVTTRLVKVYTDTVAPSVMLGRMRIMTPSGMQYPSVVDTFLSRKDLSRDSLARVLTALAHNGNNLFEIAGGVPQVQWAQASQVGSHDTLQQLVRRGDTVDLLMMAMDQSSIAGHGMWKITSKSVFGIEYGIDSLMLESPYLHDTAQWIQGHPTQWIYRVIADRPEIELHSWARDAMGNMRTTVMYLIDSSADLQVIDSANDRCRGADIGEVYMRQSHGIALKNNKMVLDTSLWTHWLIHIRNSKDTAHWEPIRLYIDADNDSTTGVPTGALQGADSALDLIRGKAIDDGTGAFVRKLAWDNGVWKPVTGYVSEGRYDSLGLAQSGNHADDPTTAAIGTGIQVTPLGTTAYPEMGVWEVGWKLGHGGKVQPLRWALISADSCGDTVLDTAGRMFHFTPIRLKNVTEDGQTSDWRVWNGDTRLIVYSADTVSTYIRSTIAVRNVGLNPINGFRASYYFHSALSPVLSWDSTGRAESFAGKVVVGPAQRLWDANHDSSYWRVDIGCSGCQMGTGGEMFRLGTLVRQGTVVTADWSANGNSLVSNPRIPAWLNSGRLIWGIEPALSSVRPTSPLDSIPGMAGNDSTVKKDSIVGVDTIQAIGYGAAKSFGGLNYLESWSVGAGVKDSISWIDSVKTSCAALGSVTSNPILRMGFQGRNLLGVKFGTSDTSLLSRYSNLEFWVASSRDWPSRRDRDIPVRVWLTHQVMPGTGDDNNSSEEDFTYLQAFLPSGHLSQKWQKVSIPLTEVFQKLNNPANGSNDSLFLKFMLDNSGTSGDIDSSRRADLLFSGMHFVKYGNSSKISTRKYDVTLVGENTNGVSGTYMILNPRLLNASSVPLSQDSLRLRFAVYDSLQPRMYFNGTSGNVGDDESVDDSWFSPSIALRKYAGSVSVGLRRANYEATLAWGNKSALMPLRGWQAQSSFMLPKAASLHLADGQSTQYSMPDYSKSYSFLSGVAADYLQPDGTWRRLWGILPTESADTVKYWHHQYYHSPSDTVFDVGAWRDLGSCKDSTLDTNSIKNDSTGNAPILTSSDSAQDIVISAFSASTVNTFGGMHFVTAWYENSSDTSTPVLWRDSVLQGCSGILKPVDQGKILTIHFDGTSLQGLKFFTTDTGLIHRYTHLDFWVAASKEWDSSKVKDQPVRIWMNHQFQMRGNDENHNSEEDFSLLQGYMPRGHQTLQWQKVSIPVSELFQTLNNSANGSSDSLFLKFMLDLTSIGFTTADLRADVHFSGIQWVKRDTSQGMVTTRNTDVIVETNRTVSGYMGTDGYIANFAYALEMRLVNQSGHSINSQRLKLRLPVSSEQSLFNPGLSDIGNGRYLASDDVIGNGSAWFASQPRTDMVPAISYAGVNLDREIRTAWNGFDSIGSSRSVGLRLDIWASESSLNPFWEQPKSRTNPFILNGIAVEYLQNDGTYKRIWGYLPGERLDTLHYWHLKKLGRPADSVAPVSSWRAITECPSAVSQCHTTKEWTLETWSRNEERVKSATRNGTLIHVPFSDSATIGVQLRTAATGWDPIHEPSFVRFKIRALRQTKSTDLRFWINRSSHFKSVSPIDEAYGLDVYEPSTEDYLHLSSYLQRDLDTNWQWVQIPLSVMRDFAENAPGVADEGVRIKWMRELARDSKNLLSSTYRFDLELDSVNIGRTQDSVGLGGRVLPTSLSWTTNSQGKTIFKLVNSTRSEIKDYISTSSNPTLWIRFPGKRFIPLFVEETQAGTITAGQSRTAQISWNFYNLCASAEWIGGRGAHCALGATNSQVDLPGENDPLVFYPANGVVLEYRPTLDSVYRLWGKLADERQDTIHWWNPDGMTKYPGEYPIGCGDISTTSGGNGSTGTDSSSLPPNFLVDLKRDPNAVAHPATVAGIPAISVTQSTPDWNLSFKYKFDTAWQNHSAIDVDIYVDPSINSSTAWLGTLSAATFDGQNWSALPTISGGPITSGSWVTYRFTYSDGIAKNDSTFTLMLLANGHLNGGSTFSYSIGAIRLALPIGSTTQSNASGSASSSGSSSTTVPVVSGVEVVSIPPTTCASCIPVTYEGVSAQKLQKSSGGEYAISYSLTNTQPMKAAKSVAYDLRQPGCVGNGGEYSEIVPVNSSMSWYGQLRLRENLTTGSSWPYAIAGANAWSTVTFPWDGSSLTVGDSVATVMNIVLNTGCSESYISNLRFLP